MRLACAADPSQNTKTKPPAKAPTAPPTLPPTVPPTVSRDERVQAAATLARQQSDQAIEEKEALQNLVLADKQALQKAKATKAEDEQRAEQAVGAAQSAKAESAQAQAGAEQLQQKAKRKEDEKAQEEQAVDEEQDKEAHAASGDAADAEKEAVSDLPCNVRREGG